MMAMNGQKMGKASMILALLNQYFPCLEMAQLGLPAK
jgi:hypothetical protein